MSAQARASERALAARAPELCGQLRRRPRIATEGPAVRVIDRGTEIVYELGRRRNGAPFAGAYGWSERVRLAGERQVTTRSVATSEPYAVLEQYGRQGAVRGRVRELCRELRARGEERSAAALEAELRRAEAGERIGLRAIQTAILERIAAGTELSRLARYGGFVSAGEADPTWLKRKVGLEPTRGAPGARRRYERSIAHLDALRLAEMLAMAPRELGF